MSTDRFLIAAVTDRLIYASETTFDPADARVLLDAVPYRKTPLWAFGIAGKLPGGTSEGYAAGVGSTKIEDGKERTFEYATSQEAWTRAGQWKLLRLKTRGMEFVEIQQVMSDPTDEGRGARVLYAGDGTPVGMDIRAVRSFGLFNIVIAIPVWRAWKVPAC